MVSRKSFDELYLSVTILRLKVFAMIARYFYGIRIVYDLTEEWLQEVFDMILAAIRGLSGQDRIDFDQQAEWMFEATEAKMVKKDRKGKRPIIQPMLVPRPP